MIIVISPSVFSIAPLFYTHDTAVASEKDIDPLGAFKTDLFTGAATYEYELKVPPGTNDLEPKVSLIYNSHLAQSRPGKIGAGWTLSQSYIQRDINFTRDDLKDDEFKLILEGSTYDLKYVPSENQFHTDHESFLFIKNVSGGNNQFKTNWIVRTKDGTAYRFGYNQDSEAVSSVNNFNWNVWRWNLDLVNDTYNNQIIYTYKEDPFPNDYGAVYLDKIEYNNDKKRVIKFDYESTDRPDLWVVFDNGHKLIETRRLKNISISSDGSSVRRYRFDYLYNQTSNPAHSLLQGITEFGNDNSTFLPPTNFSYYPAVKPWILDEKWEIPKCGSGVGTGCIVINNGNDQGIRFADVNRDGLVDMIAARPDAFGGDLNGVFINNGSDWINSGGWGIPECTTSNWNGCFVDNGDNGVRLADVNGDGLPDWIKGKDGINWIRLNTGTTWETNPSSGWELPECHNNPPNLQHEGCFIDGGYNGVEIADVNNDGLADIIRGDGGSQTKTWINKNTPGNVWVVDTDWTLPDCHNIPPNADHTGCFADGGDNGARLVDINGDGLIDVLKAKNGVSRAYLNKGIGWASDPNTDPSPWRIPDCVSGSDVTCFINSGGNDNGVRLADLNGDGLTDYVKAKINSGGNGEQLIYMNNGNGWTSSTVWTIADCSGSNTRKCFVKNSGEDNGVRLVELNGDGVADIIETKESPLNQSVNIGGFLETGLLYNINNSFSGKIFINYNSSSFFNNTGNDTQNDLGFPLHVISSLVESNGMSNSQNATSNTIYIYSGGLFDYKKLDFRGFNNVVENKTSVIINHTFHQDEGRKGREFKTEIFNITSSIYQKQEFNWTANFTKMLYYVVNLFNESTRTFDGVSANPKLNNIRYRYDEFGNILMKKNEGDDGVVGDERYGYFNYLNNTNLWIVDTLMQYQLFDSDNVTKLRETKYSYDGLFYGEVPTKGDITQEEKFLSGGTNPITLYGYNSKGNLVYIIDANNHVTNYTYGLRDTTFTFPDQIINAKNHITNNFYDLGTGNLLNVSDPNGFFTSYMYDVFGRITKEIRPYDTFALPTKSYAYEFDGMPPEEIKTSLREDNGTANTIDTYEFYDGFNNIVQTKTEAENNKQIVEDTYYDNLFRVASKSNKYFTSFFENYTTPNTSVSKTSFTYDPLDRITQITNPDNTTKKFEYDDWKVTLFDENNNKKINVKDAYDQILAVIEFNPPDEYATNYTYTDAGDLINITDALGNKFTFLYDTLGRKIGIDDPDLGSWSYTYDGIDNLIQTVDERGITTFYNYDELDRIAKRNSTTQEYHYIYDKDLNNTFSSVYSRNFFMNYTYDNRLRKISEKKTVDDRGYLQRFSYDSMDRIKNIIFPNNETINYSYTDQGLIKSIQGITLDTFHNEVGKVFERIYSNDEVSNYSFDISNFRLKRIKTPNKQELDYGYNNISDVISINDTIHSRKYTMSYDPLSRLITAKRDEGPNLTFAFNFTYNSIGNMLSAVSTDKNLTFLYNSTILHAPNKILHWIGKPLEVVSLKVLSQAGLNVTFEFGIENNRDTNLTGINWRLDTGVANITSLNPISLAFNETTFVYVEYVYPSTGSYGVIAQAYTTNMSDTRSINIVV